MRKVLWFVILLVASLTAAIPAQSETYDARGSITDPDEGQVFMIPVGQFNVAVSALSEDHGVSITGNANQVITGIGWELELWHVTATNNVISFASSQTVTLDGVGFWEVVVSLGAADPDLTVYLTQGLYQTGLRSRIRKDGESQAYYEHDHDWRVSF